MPTTRQLFTIWESAREFFGGSGEPRQNSEADENSIASPKHIDATFSSNKFESSIEGRALGHLKYDVENDDVQIVFP